MKSCLLAPVFVILAAAACVGSLAIVAVMNEMPLSISTESISSLHWGDAGIVAVLIGLLVVVFYPKKRKVLY
jgi:hypothetical protein